MTYTAGKKVSSDLLKSAGKPAGVRILPDEKKLAADGQSLSFAVVEIVDENGNLVPTAEIKATAKVEGAATLAAFGTGRPITDENYTKGKFTSYKGKLLTIVRANYEPGASTLTVNVEGLPAATVEISVT